MGSVAFDMATKASKPRSPFPLPSILVGLLCCALIAVVEWGFKGFFVAFFPFLLILLAVGLFKKR